MAPLKLFLCGDVMTGRGIDYILPHAGDPTLYEPYVSDAATYVELAAAADGPIARPVAFDYIWGDALAVLNAEAPDLRLINLETAITTSPQPWPDKVVTYRMHPANLPCLTAAGIDGCALANNHVLDWGEAGLRQTLAALQQAGIRCAGAGRSAREAAAPAIFDTPAKARLLFFSLATPSSGVPLPWRAGPDHAGINLLPDLAPATAAAVAAHIAGHRQAGDRVVVSIHWGENWGYRIADEQRNFARALVDAGAADLVHGHSSHHPKGIELYRGRLILYGCGDLINDYAGIGGHETFRGELTALYFATLGGDGRLAALRLVPMRLRRLQLRRADADEVAWLCATLNRHGPAQLSCDSGGALQLTAG